LLALAAAALTAPLATFACQETAPPLAPTQAAADAPPPSAPRGGPIELLLTGDDDGYLDACGCDEGLLGGLPRRKRAMQNLGVEDGHALVLSNGGLAPLRTGVAPDAPERDLDRWKLNFQLLAMVEMPTRRSRSSRRAPRSAARRSSGGGTGSATAARFIATNLVDYAGGEPTRRSRSSSSCTRSCACCATGGLRCSP
jgi:hypothetical protein